MHRIDGPGVVEALPKSKESGLIAGYFDGGNPATGRMSTVVTSEWCNSVQEELAGVVEASGRSLDKNDNTQLLLAIRHFIAELVPEGNLKPLSLGDIDFFNRKAPPKGYAVANGAFLVNADALCPALWAFLQDSENAWQLKTEEEWQAAIHEDGVGGANAFVLDIGAKTLRLPDIRGDYMAGAGWNEKAVGDCDGDAVRNITGTAFLVSDNTHNVATRASTGVFGLPKKTTMVTSTCGARTLTDTYGMELNTSLRLPTDTRNHPNTIYMLPCIYVGVPVLGALSQEPPVIS